MRADDGWRREKSEEANGVSLYLNAPFSGPLTKKEIYIKGRDLDKH